MACKLTKGRPSIAGFAVALCINAALGFQSRAETAANPKAVELLAHASKSFEAGAYADAESTIDQAFKAGLTGELASRALFIRAEVNEKNGKLARALSDYSSALWMQNLPPAQSKAAAEGKGRVIAAMGLGDRSGGSGHGAAASAQATEVPSNAVQPESQGGLTTFFSGLFSGTPDKKDGPQEPPLTAPAVSPAAPPQTAPAASAVKQAAASAPAPKKSPKPVAKAAAFNEAALRPAAAVMTPVAATPAAAGGFYIDFGSAAGASAASTKAMQIKAKVSDVLVNRELLVQGGSGGASRVLAGPYKTKGAASALCAEIKNRGVACQVSP